MHKLITAAILAILTIKFVDFELSSNSELSDNDKKKIRSFVGTFAGIVSVNILLPIIFLESFYVNIGSRNMYRNTVIAGLVFAVITFCIGYALSKIVFTKIHNRWADIATATFGGGNRGILLLTTIVIILEKFNLTTHSRHEYLTYFYAFDLGNFISFFIMISTIISIRGNSNKKFELAKLASIKSILTDFSIKIGLSSFLIAFVILASFLHNKFGWPLDIIDFIKSTSNGRKFMLLYFALVATFLHVNLANKCDQALKDFSFLIIVRVFTSSSFLLVSSQLMPGKNIELLTHPLSVAIVVLSCCPPSSLLPVQIRKYGNSESALISVSNLNILSNGIFFILLGIVFLITLCSNFFNYQ